MSNNSRLAKFFNASLKFGVPAKAGKEKGHQPFSRSSQNKFCSNMAYKEDTDKHTKRVIIRLKPDDEAQLREGADRHGVKVSTYCRNILLNVGEENIFLDPEIRRTLVGLANNLNQLAYHFNRTGQQPPQELADCKKIVEIYRHAHRQQ
ncbi:MAG TPA: plasmid mobilization relaxosome protein MobC [Sphingobacterium sp.]|nr:plasmid mobilization relaxosome protein MobC [Sphingobacterium sp.]